MVVNNLGVINDRIEEPYYNLNILLSWRRHICHYHYRHRHHYHHHQSLDPQSPTPAHVKSYASPHLADAPAP